MLAQAIILILPVLFQTASTAQPLTPVNASNVAATTIYTIVLNACSSALQPCTHHSISAKIAPLAA